MGRTLFAATRGFVLVALTLTAPMLSFASPASDELQKLLSSGSARRYVSMTQALTSIIAISDAENLPSMVLVDRFREGAAKSAPADALVAAGQLELDRLRVVARLLRESGNVSLREPARVYGTLSLCLRAGLDQGSLAQLIHASGVGGIDRAVGVCETLLKLTGITTLNEGELARLGKALLNSRVPLSGYGALVGVFAKARGARLDDGTTLDLVVSVLERGGGLLQVNDSVEAASRRGTSR